MKYFIAFCVSGVIATIIILLNQYILKIHIPDFLAGWISCMGYFITIKLLKAK